MARPVTRSRHCATRRSRAPIRPVEAFKLSPDTKTYGDAAQLAADPDVDLVVCNVGVDRHHETIRPSVAVGKAVFCEWPLASNLD